MEAVIEATYRSLCDGRQASVGFKRRTGTTILYLFRRNLLRHEISKNANTQLKDALAHPKTAAELASARGNVTLFEGAELVSDMVKRLEARAKVVGYYAGIPSLFLAYEDLVPGSSDAEARWAAVFEVLRASANATMKTPKRPLVAIHQTRAILGDVDNAAAVRDTMRSVCSPEVSFGGACEEVLAGAAAAPDKAMRSVLKRYAAANAALAAAAATAALAPHEGRRTSVRAHADAAPCRRLEAALTRDDAGRRASALRDCGACLAHLDAAMDAYFEFLPLVSARLFQLQVYGWADGRTGNASAFRALADRRAALAARADPALARPAAARRRMDASVANYGQCARSGRRLAAGADPSEDCGAAAAREPNGTASLLAHLHLTFHGGTALLDLIKSSTCMLLPKTCAANANVRPDKRGAVDLLAVTAAANRCNDQRCGKNFASLAAPDDDGAVAAPVDAVFFEPSLPRHVALRWLDSPKIVFSTVARHPSFFALTRGLQAGKHPDFLLHAWQGKSPPPSYCTVLAETHVNEVRRRVDAGAIEAPKGLDACLRGGRASRAPNATRADLAAARAKMARFAVVVVAEESAPPASARAGDRVDGAPQAAADRVGRRLRPAPAPHHGAEAALGHYGLDRAAFAALVDASQLSLELYFFARELNRADHRELGLRPPSTGLAAPGEFEGVFF
ncbi:hypothetical protein JL721_6381 [Aureococcus anophagefferens]|nr:hypothetical protein JL721_6381 [Aureococcus anophagefferens]